MGAFARAGRFSPPPTSRNRCVAAPASPLYTHIRHKARIPGVHGAAAAKGPAFDEDASRRRAGFASRPRLGPRSGPPPRIRSHRPGEAPDRARAGRRRARFRPAKPRPNPPLRVAAIRGGLRGPSRRVSTTSARGTASCLDLDRSVFARKNTFVACIANV